MKIRVRQATPEFFSRYGSVVVMPLAKPTSEGADYRFWSDIASYRIDGETEIGICTVYQQPKAEIVGMERHLRTPEILIPIDAPFVVPLLLEGNADKDAEAFRVNLGEAVVIESGVWHGACLPVGKEQSSYFVIFRRNTPHEDVHKKPVEPFDIVIE